MWGQSLEKHITFGSSKKGMPWDTLAMWNGCTPKSQGQSTPKCAASVSWNSPNGLASASGYATPGQKYAVLTGTNSTVLTTPKGTGSLSTFLTVMARSATWSNDKLTVFGASKLSDFSKGSATMRYNGPTVGPVIQDCLHLNTKDQETELDYQSIFQWHNGPTPLTFMPILGARFKVRNSTDQGGTVTVTTYP